MKQLLGIGLVLILSFNLIGQEIINGYKSGRQIIGTKVERNLAGETIWTDRDSSNYIFDEQQRLVKKESLYFIDSIWLNHTNTLWEYDTDNQGFVETNQQWDGSKFVELSTHKITYEYNAQNELVHRYLGRWINETWKHTNRNSYNYDEWGNISRIGRYQSVNDEWRLYWEEVFTFDSLGTQISMIEKIYDSKGLLEHESGNRIEKDTIKGLPVIDFWQLWDGNWALKERKTNFYSHTNLLDSTLIQRFPNNSISPNQKLVYQYNANDQLIQKSYYRIQENGSQPYYQIKYEYNKQEQLVLQEYFLWSEEEGWTNYRVGNREWIYSEAGILLKEVEHTGWILERPPWQAYDRNITYYAKPLSVSVSTVQKEYDVQIFPNPTRHFLNIKGIGNITFPLKMTILNLQGQILKQQNINALSVVISLNDLPNGSYFIQLKDKFGVIKTEKFMKQ